MARTTGGTRTTRISKVTPTGTYGTSSDFDPNSNFEDPNDLSDVAGLDADIGGNSGTPPRRPPMGGIDLGKGLDLEKPKPPRSAIGIEIAKSPQGNLGIGVEVPIGLSPFGARGGVSIDPATGKIRGGYGGLGIGKGPIGASIDVGVDTPPGSDKPGCYKYVTVSLGPFSHTYGQNNCEPKSPVFTNPKEPTPGMGSPVEDIIPLLEDSKCYHAVILNHVHISLEFIWDPDPNVFVRASAASDVHGQGVWTNNQTRFFAKVAKPLPQSRTPAYIEFHDPPNVPLSRQSLYPNEFNKYKGNFKAWASINNNLNIYIPGGYQYSEIKPHPDQIGSIAGTGAYIKDWIQRNKLAQSIWDVSVHQIPCNLSGGTTDLPKRVSPPEPPSGSPFIPNPRPRKKMDKDCCKISIQLQLEILRQLGREIGPSGVIQQSNKPGFIGEQFERVSTPIKDPEKPEKVKIQFSRVYDLLMYALVQSNNLDTALDPQSYKLPTGKLQNPNYSRDSEESLKTNNQPSKDKSGNKRELEINKDDEVRMSGFLQQQSYAFQMLRRLEYLFPYGELSDSVIAKDLLIPGGKGDIKIHNMIHGFEVQMQYLNGTLGNPREILTVKDANPAIKGDQPVEVHALSISDLLRQNIKFHIDTGGDVDALVNLVLRDFRTSLAVRVDQIKTAEMVQALFEDSGMREQQDYIPLHLEGDPYAGQWVKGEGFKPNPDLEKKTEEATEKVLQQTMVPTEVKIKVSRRHKEEKTDMRDLIRGLADFFQRLLSVPTGSDAAATINKLVENAKFKVQTEMALIRQNVTQAAAASRNRTKKRKK